MDFLKLAASKSELLIDASLSNDSRLRASLLKQMKPWTPTRQIRLADQDGIPAFSYTQEQEIIQSRFASVLRGSTTTMADIIEKRRACHADNQDANNAVLKTLNAVPSMQFLQVKTATSKTRKALSDSRLGAEIRKLVPHAIAEAYHPVHVKSSLRIDGLEAALLHFTKAEAPLRMF